jgi:hypothetical protein
LPTRPMACPSHKPVVRCKSFLYQAASWKIARRMVAKVEFHFGKWFYNVISQVYYATASLGSTAPEPGTLVLMAGAFFALVVSLRHKRNAGADRHRA